MKRFLIFCGLLFLAGCSVKTVPSATEYTLKIAQQKIPTPDSSACTKQDLKVLEPFGSSEYVTTDLYYVVLPFEENRYAQSAWSQSVASTIYEELLSALRQSKLFKGVASYASVASSDLILEVELNDFKQYFSHNLKSSYIVSDITFTLVEAKTHKAISQKQIRKQITTKSLDAKGGVEALNEALDETVAEALMWLGEHCR